MGIYRTGMEEAPRLQRCDWLLVALLEADGTPAPLRCIEAAGVLENRPCQRCTDRPT